VHQELAAAAQRHALHRDTTGTLAYLSAIDVFWNSATVAFEQVELAGGRIASPSLP
jgi:hypothetical protein